MKIRFYALILSLSSVQTWAVAPDVTLKVWTNEAIINVYTFTDQNWDTRQKDMAIYFRPSAWQAYLAAMNQSNILKLVKQNHMSVSAVATQPPQIKAINATTYQAHMPILVAYSDAKNTQVQHLSIDLEIIKTKIGSTNGYAINRFTATIENKPCQCSDNSANTKVTIV